MTNLLIDHQCPQCGAPAVLEETDRLFICEFCRVKSYLLEKDFFRYIIPGNAPGNKELVFFPYWRFRGMFFSSLRDEIHHRFVDISRQAVDSREIPISLGLRSQALKLKFLSPETQGSFFKPKLSLKKVMRIFETSFSASLKKPLFHQAFIGETLSLIYAPFYMDSDRRQLYDAVLNKSVASSVPEDFAVSGEQPDWQIRFVPTLCPNCGWDLKGQRDSLVLTCKNCNSVWQAGRKGLKKLIFSVLQGTGDNDVYLPFWRIKTDISGIILDSYANLVRIANMPKAVQEGWDDIRFHFWALAFKVPPQSFLRLGSNVTLAQPNGELLPELPDAPVYPVTLPVTEAVESLKISLSNFMKPRRGLLPRLPHITMKPKSFLLVYVPFKETHHDFIHPEYQLTVNKNMLRMGGNL
ncbi:MAG: hypothetical protein GY749_48740 [Desulfobacteraceae bacterium]|nr:hypothetical protein [Desulfobacteraceae bacterium]